jgi:regulator of cell morphogenesis and NO signaling
MNNFATKTVRDIALENPATTRVFEEFKIDYCCGGRKPLSEACATAGVDESAVSLKLEQILSQTVTDPEAIRWESRTSAELIDHIVEKHHVFTKFELSRLGMLMEKVAQKHGPDHPELLEIRAAFVDLTEELMPHMMKEENVLFPFIKTLELSAANHMTVPPPHFVTVQNPVRMMMTEHEAAGDLLRKMREDSNNYALPEGACPSYTALFHGIQELETDLFRHIHLENNVLFPKAIEMESQASQSLGAAIF